MDCPCLILQPTTTQTSSSFNHFNHQKVGKSMHICSRWKCFDKTSVSIPCIHSPMDASVGKMGFSVLPKDSSTCGPGKPGVEPPTFPLVGLSLVTSRPDWEDWLTVNQKVGGLIPSISTCQSVFQPDSRQ